MRITEEERAVLTGAVLSRDPGARVWLFGSRVDDAKRGGDPFFRLAVETGVRIDE